MDRVRNQREVDRISALPDFLVQHILSLLPSTKEAIRTSILSKRWKDQWARAPVLILNPSGMSDEKFFQFTENVLLRHASFKIKKFYIEYGSSFKKDTHFSAKICFAARRNVEELILKCGCNFEFVYIIPEFIYEHASLVKLCTNFLSLSPNKKVSWGCLKELSLTFCNLPDEAVDRILSGSPLIERLELSYCYGFNQLVIFSNSLKRLVLENLRNCSLQISCPSLEELSVSRGQKSLHFNLCNQVIEDVLSRSQLLKSLELCRCNALDHLVIASKTLRRLVLEKLEASAIDISCPNLKELKLEDLKVAGSIKLMN